MELIVSVLGTIKRALLVYNFCVNDGIIKKSSFKDIDTYYEDICNLNKLLHLID